MVQVLAVLYGIFSISTCLRAQGKYSLEEVKNIPKKKFDSRLIDLSIDLMQELNLENYPAYLVSYKANKNGLEITVRLPTKHSEKILKAIEKFKKKEKSGDQLLIVPMYRWATEAAIEVELLKERDHMKVTEYID